MNYKIFFDESNHLLNDSLKMTDDLSKE